MHSIPLVVKFIGICSLITSAQAGPVRRGTGVTVPDPESPVRTSYPDSASWESWASISTVTSSAGAYATGSHSASVGLGTTSRSSTSSARPTSSAISPSPVPAVPGIRNIAYYVNWAIYGRNFTVQDLDTGDLTHVSYAFANVNTTTGEVYLSDLWADIQKTWLGDDSNEPGTNVYGNLKQLYLRKKQNRNLKTQLAVGGWTYSPNFAAPAGTEAGRQRFAKSAVVLVQDLGFDGLDIDWEYPSSEKEAADFVSLLRTVREELDASTSRNHQNRFLLSIAVSAGPQHYSSLDMSAMDPYLDHWSLMAYDYVVASDNLTAHQANLYASKVDPKSTPYNTDDAVTAYLDNGVPSAKIVLGIPIYGRSVVNSTGPGTRAVSDPNGSWEAGVWDYKALPKAGATEFYDPRIGAAYSFDNSTGNWITYDTVSSVTQKASYVGRRALGGGMFWETSADKPRGQGSLISAFADVFGGGASLQAVGNELSYPESKYDNIRNHMSS